MKKTIRLALCAALSFSAAALPASQNSTDAVAQATVFREPFTLKLRTNNGQSFEQQFDKVPYVDRGDIYLFAGEHFGVNVSIAGNEISGLVYQRDPNKADVDFKFTQEVKTKPIMMMLVIHNRLKQPIFVDALMTVPDRKGAYKTSVVPVRPGLSDFESWPHPIMELVLRNLRLSKDAPIKGGQPSGGPPGK